MHLNNPECAAGALLFIIENVRCLKYSHCRGKPAQMWSLVTSKTSLQLCAGHWDTHRDKGQCVLMTAQ